jgi:hypothetical protein
MKDALPKKVKKVECGIINLNNSDEGGSHWTAYYKRNNKKFYFDSYGYAAPPKELENYLGLENLFYNQDAIQTVNDPQICGHLCLLFLQKLSNGKDYNKTIKNLKLKK